MLAEVIGAGTGLEVGLVFTLIGAAIFVGTVVERQRRRIEAAKDDAASREKREAKVDKRIEALETDVLALKLAEAGRPSCSGVHKRLTE